MLRALEIIVISILWFQEMAVGRDEVLTAVNAVRSKHITCFFRTFTH
jgi:hypothetical protein